MAFATVTSKGQVTIPVAIRREMDIKPGTRLEFLSDGDGTFRVVRKKRALAELYGAIPYDGPSLSVEEMDEAIARAMLESCGASLAALGKASEDEGGVG
jgi:AbrB family looped-hinge helix DNA binding protein